MSSSLAGKPAQWLLIRDPSISGGSDVATATTEAGPEVGITAPAAANVGALIPTFLEDPGPDDTTALRTTLQLSAGGGLGKAEWCYLPGVVDDSTRTEEWRGYSSELYAWGHHTPVGSSSSTGGVVVYSSVYRRILVITVNASGTVVVDSVGADERPNGSGDWTSLSSFTPDAGVSTYDHALAACELRDGTLLLVVRRQNLDSVTGDVPNSGDWDLYRSTDGGATWILSVENLVSTYGSAGSSPDNYVTPRIAASGAWVRFMFSISSGTSLVTLVSSDNGVTWKASADTIGTITIKTDQVNDQMTFDLIGLNDATGSFLVVGGETAAKNLRFWAATRDGSWTVSDLAGAITGLPTLRTVFFIRDPYWMYVWAHFNDEGNTERRWQVYRAKRENVLSSSAWETVANPLLLQAAAKLAPIQSHATWAGDRAVVLSYVQSQSGAPYDYQGPKPIIYWVGGWSIRPVATDYLMNDGLVECLHWDYSMGMPAGGATSATQSIWTNSTSGAGTHSWTTAKATFETYAIADIATQIIKFDPTAFESPPQWDPVDADEERKWKQTKKFGMEFVASVGSAASAIVLGGAAAEITMVSAQSPPDGWKIQVRLDTDQAVVYDMYGPTPLATLSGLNLATADTNTYHRFRLCVSPAASPSDPMAVLQYRDDTADAWTQTDPFSLGQPNTAAALTETTFIFGNLVHSAGAATTLTSQWREARIFSQKLRTDYAGTWSAPENLPGARAAGRGRSLGSGATTADSYLLSAAWGGGGGAKGDAFQHDLEHSEGAENCTGIDSPAVPWASVAGATAWSTWIQFDAGHGAQSANAEEAYDSGQRFIHSHAAIFGLQSPTGRVEYADDADFTAITIAATYSSIIATGVTSATVDGWRVGLSAAGLTRLRAGELGGKILYCTGGAAINQTWKILRHELDDVTGYHFLELDGGGQFGQYSLAAGQTFAVASDRVWLDYGQTIRARYARIRAGLIGTNNISGKWGVGQFVPGLAWQIDPPLDWSHTDEDRPNVSLFKTRGGASWARKEGPEARTITARAIGDDKEALHRLRSMLRNVASYQVEPMAFLLDGEKTEGQDDSLILCRWQGGSILDQQAWRRDAADIARRLGDEQMSFDEIV